MQKKKKKPKQLLRRVPVLSARVDSGHSLAYSVMAVAQLHPLMLDLPGLTLYRVPTWTGLTELLTPFPCPNSNPDILNIKKTQVGKSS